MIIKIESENKYLLDILHKNPNTDFGLYAKPLRDGVLVGNAISPNEYHCFFQDNKHSYMPDDANPIDFQSFASPLLALNITTELFNHLFKPTDILNETVISWLSKSYQEIDNVACKITVETFFIDSGWYRNNDFLLSRYIDGIEVLPKQGNNYQLIFITNSVRESIQKLAVVSMFVNFSNRYAQFTYIDDSLIQKYITILSNIKGLPYFVFYLFIKKIMRSPKQFESHKTQLEAYFDHQIQFVFTDTHQSRKNFIAKKLNFDEPILDFGCGELQYFKLLHNKGFKKEYLAFDKEDFSETANRIMAVENANNLVFTTNIDDLKGFTGQVILSEVIEHNTMENAITLLHWIKENTNFCQLFITTPDKDFNQNYEMTTEFRHDDHDFELTNSEFRALIESIFKTENKEYYGIGDCVRGVYPTSCVVLRKLKD